MPDLNRGSSAEKNKTELVLEGGGGRYFYISSSLVAKKTAGLCLDMHPVIFLRQTLRSECELLESTKLCCCEKVMMGKEKNVSRVSANYFVCVLSV